MANFEERKAVSVLESRYEVSIELENLQKNLAIMSESLDRLEKRIEPILKQVPKSQITTNKIETSQLVELAMKIQGSNRHLEQCNSRIIDMIDSCQL